ncbi:MalY/PatB family protein [Deinococcus sp.]|uniref:MalY/PatB family protein n=1 Tax=Deinococcus sp. TaxID=47478 RepID=UPI0025BD06C5|nr:MalY/PatB family protein [Deinococcus sp.]
MTYESLSAAQLRHSDSIKWNQYDEGVLPMWIADMDFPVAPPILRALHERLERPIGYAPGNDATLVGLLQAKFAAQGLGGLSSEGMHFLPGVVPGLYAAVNGLTAPGEHVVTMTPVYHPFHLAITHLGRKVSSVPLIDGPERWEIDWDALDAACAHTKLLMICHPHNPTGRIWDSGELRRLRELALKHDLYVVSDELHADLRYTSAPFEAFAADPRTQPRTLTLTGPCKAFNTAGLGIGVMATHNTELLERVKTAVSGLMGHPSALSQTMWKAALQEGGPWLAGTVEYLKGNRDLLYTFVQERLPWVQFHVVEATYLAWLDLRGHAEAGDIQNFLLKEGRVAIHNGPIFAPEEQQGEYQGFIRVNFAMPRPMLQEALERMAKALA